tara:strand:+ start:26 stop:403 length:378 start_codon:yes stop_codon:yes gene_type:complete
MQSVDWNAAFVLLNFENQQCATAWRQAFIERLKKESLCNIDGEVSVDFFCYQSSNFVGITVERHRVKSESDPISAKAIKAGLIAAELSESAKHLLNKVVRFEKNTMQSELDRWERLAKRMDTLNI